MTSNDVQKLYIAYFNRPGDPAGLQYWLQSGASPEDIADAFSKSTEYTSRFTGMDHGAIVRQVYLNLFGRDAEASGVAYWQDLLDKGALHVADVVTSIFGGAQGSDGVALDHKLEAAGAFSQTLVTTTGAVAAYSGGSASAIARAWLDSVNDVVDFPTPNDLQASVDKAIAQLMTMPNVVLSGHVQAGGYVAGATVFLDLNGNGALDTGEASAITNSHGAFHLFGYVGAPAQHSDGILHVPVLAQGGTDTQTGQENHAVLSSGFDATYYYMNQYMHGIGFTEAHLDLTPPGTSPIHNAGIILTGIPEGAAI